MAEGYTTVVRGERVELPNTLGKIRAALPEERRAAFDEEMYSTPLDQIQARALLGWALPPEADAEDDEAAAQARAGERFGFFDHEGKPRELGD
ncbi:hypothetical protein ACFRCG_06970 [Embleya sp. NPDC056575]|uniref:hypothetical protein n=1 Tax=unclassified Embleya TaxID=2699296 RepID=UPI0036ADCAD0